MKRVIFAHERQGKADLIRVWEMKGDQLEGNLDTKYKRAILEIMSEHFTAEDGVKAGKSGPKGKRLSATLF